MSDQPAQAAPGVAPLREPGAAAIRAAFDPPRAHGAPLSAAQIRATPEDFQVEEMLSFEPSDAGPHWLLQVEKRGANTRWVAAEIARLCAVHPNDVGYAGMKDRHALTVQWFSVPAGARDAAFWRQVSTQEYRVLEVRANDRKLRRGALKGNRFRISLREAAWSREQLQAKLAALGQHGVPNYFGPQRFGREGFNLRSACAWAGAAEAAPRGRAQREFALSAARAVLFNALLAARVQAGDWSRLNPGDVAILDGSNSHFEVPAVDATLQARLAAFDLHPSGPLWGRGALRTQGTVREVEINGAAELAPLGELLAAQGLQQERRALRMAVRGLRADYQPGVVQLSFELGRGQFATAVLREICELTGAPAFDSGED